MNILNRRPKKSSDFESYVLDKLECIQKSQAYVLRSETSLREDIEKIVHDEVLRSLKEYQRRGWSQIS